MLKNLFVSEVRIKILQLFFIDSTKDEDLHVRAIVRRVGAEINAVRRELDNLNRIGLLDKRQSSNRLYYSMNPAHVFYPELLSLVIKERGFGAEIIKHAKEFGDIEFVVLSRAFLMGRDASPLEVDLFMVGDGNFENISRIIKNHEKKIGKEINYTIMPSEEFKFRKRKNDSFIVKVLSQSRIMLVGDEEKFYSIV